MEIKIGVQHAPREIVVETNLEADAVADLVRGAGDLLELTDTKGRRVIVPVAKLAYVEIGSPSVGAVGFRG
ncbi:DUF3107 domain-containing protein [Nocardioides sp. ChNu-153]|uniref:DUF3107 domain-containing protein n=1 Tax=unclassified Nocardioides TaxID=2615069 RepID=UPI002405E01E|nr:MULTISPECIES: DUF3107 domain-containing protein [unclassified Nocardioides]MDF9717431.1 DUF3107 domain-containing protein [Nocardioides sp. ChNu-99]MDN7120863.1 DUF3107 domain-containing protein [Nocardioides sp. ChNu-153]